MATIRLLGNRDGMSIEADDDLTTGRCARGIETGWDGTARIVLDVYCEIGVSCLKRGDDLPRSILRETICNHDFQLLEWIRLLPYRLQQQSNRRLLIVTWDDNGN